MFNWDQNDWTERLCYAIPKCFKVTTSYTAEKGPRWDTKILGLLKVSKLMSAAFLFRGAPDIIINKDKLLVTPGMDVSDDVSSEEKSTALIEYSLQPTNLKSEKCARFGCASENG